MKNLLLLIISVLILIGVLEFKGVIPPTALGVVTTLSAIADYIRSLHIQSYYIIIPDVSISVTGILLTLLLLFVIGYLLERFRTIEHNQKVLLQKIHALSKNQNSNEDSHKESGDDMKQVASEIRDFLSILSDSINRNLTTPIRVKKIRRASSEALNSNTSIDDNYKAAETNEISDKMIVDDIPSKNVSDPHEKNNKQDQDNTIPEDESDSNLSRIDLARALIESDEIDKAREIIVDIIKNGSAIDAHEARILNLQIS